jgi:hypothetical protein
MPFAGRGKRWRPPLKSEAAYFERLKSLNFEEKAAFFRLDLERAKFLAACPHGEYARLESNRTQVIPYDPAIQIKEAFRLGIGLSDTAQMMEMTETEVMSYRLPFPAKSKLPKGTNSSQYNLMPQYEINPDVCFR